MLGIATIIYHQLFSHTSLPNLKSESFKMRHLPVETLKSARSQRQKGSAQARLNPSRPSLWSILRCWIAVRVQNTRLAELGQKSGWRHKSCWLSRCRKFVLDTVSKINQGALAFSLFLVSARDLRRGRTSCHDIQGSGFPSAEAPAMTG